MRILVAGDGVVGRALADGLAAAGVTVDRWSRSHAPAVAPRDAAIVAVSDPAIAEVAERLLDERQVSDWTVLLHCAGALSPEEVFAGVHARVRGVGLLHPLRAFSGREPAGDPTGAVDLVGSVFGVAGDEAGRPLAAELVRRLGGRPLTLDGVALARYHAAAVLAGNHTLALVDAAIELLSGLGLDRGAAAQALGGLLASAAANVARLGLPQALTGPIARGDAAIVARHLAALPPAVAELYRDSARPTLALARRKGVAAPDALDAVARALVRPSPPAPLAPPAPDEASPVRGAAAAADTIPPRSP